MKRRMCVAAALLLGACAQGVTYVPPTKTYARPKNSVTVNAPKEAVWKKLVIRLAQNFYIVNNMDKESGFINFSYSGDPQPYVDCGMMTSHFENAVASETKTFPGSSHRMDFDYIKRPEALHAHREMELDAQASMILQPIAADTTSVSLNTKYKLTRTTTYRNLEGRSWVTRADTSFRMGESATLPGNPDQLQCVPTGKLERDILGLVKK